MGTEAPEVFLSGRTETETVPGLSVVKGEEESVEAREILTEAARATSPRLPSRWKSMCRKARKSIYVCADSSH